MTATLIKGTEIREQILEEITAEVEKIKENTVWFPGWSPFSWVKIRHPFPT
jgi:methylenetetrahydrofolate dehydrogenase (NADP+)/methenyltetrahydrofolate cyclohydrolase